MLSYVYSEKAKKGSVMERRKKDRISSQESKTAEPEYDHPAKKVIRSKITHLKEELTIKQLGIVFL